MFNAFFTALQDTPWAKAITESTWLFPTIETVHVAAITLVVGSIMVVDLRLLNLASRDRPVREVADYVLPWTWTAFVVAVITGSLLFSSAAVRYLGIWQFPTKLVMIALAGINMAVFHLGAYRRVAAWDSPPAVPPPAAKLSAGLSLLIWGSVIVLGRWIGFM